MKKGIIVLACLTLVALAGNAWSQQPQTSPQLPEKAAKPKLVALSPEEAKAMGKVDLLFVQNARNVTLDKNKMVMKGVSPTTLFFSDRPERLTGHLSTQDFIPFWSEGPDSFAADPPNATLSIPSGGKVSDIVVELRNPRLTRDELTYDVRVLEGAIQAQGGACSLFIDIIGRPLTPLSVAGARRRCWRRARY